MNDSKATLDEMKAFGKKVAAGEATLRDQLNALKSVPPEWRTRLAQHPKCKILRPGIYEESISRMEELLRAEETPTNASDSQLAAVLRIVAKRIKVSIVELMARLPGAVFNISKHVESGMPLRKESLEDYDKYLFAMLRFDRPSRKTPSLGDRIAIALEKNDRPFLRRLERAYKKPELRWSKLIQDLQVKDLNRCLLCFWDEIPGVEPRIGLSEFTYDAISDFCNVCFDPNGIFADDRFAWERVRDAVRRLKLQRKPRTVTAFKSDGKQAFITLNRKKVILMKR